MGNVFSTAGNETLIIYPQNNAISLLVTSGIRPCQPTVLEEDFRSNFSAFAYNQTIYYTYINTRGEIVVKNIRDNTTYLTVMAEDDTSPYKEALAEAEKKIASLEQTIESAKEQYATLMETATKYREEAQKWFLIAKKHKK